MSVIDGGLEILLADDEPTIQLSACDALRAAGHNVTLASDGARALECVRSRVFDLVVTDIRMPKADGLEVFRETRAQSPGTAVILMTAYGNVDDAVTALKHGATDYMTKPFDLDELLVRVERIAHQRRLEAELEGARRQLAAEVPRKIIGATPAIQRLRELITTVADSDANVMILGESGTGKELVARAVHEQSSRSTRAFVAVNCAAFPDTLLEAELFGHERGAFSGAVRRRDGRFRAAHEGTLFLDEIAEIPLPAQAKLLRVLQEGSFEPLGTNTSVRVDVRVLSATHRNLKERIAEGAFREDLYYRLKVIEIRIPPLRERMADLPLLLEHFSKKHGAAKLEITPRAWAAVSAYPFPGNIRELEHAIEHALVLARGAEIDLEHLPQDLQAGVSESDAPGQVLRPLAGAVKAFERQYLLRALAAAEGQRARTAELLGISRKNLWEKLRAHDLSHSDLED
jgi:DNA-binding NtrC family response regulator